uniref:CHASE3 domain-containing protein n=1 Tax=Sphingomonas bacterium TaxID=1895847 RepID=UPI0026271500|nr:CHASE3 domain-containing protein [Sphingomonas bacterium]
MKLLIGFAIVIAMIVGAIWLTRVQEQASASVRHTLEVENRVRGVLSRLQDAETGQRGYLLTGRAEFLDPYDSALVHLDGDLSGLEQAIADNPRQRARVARLRHFADARLDLLRVSVVLYQNSAPNRIDVDRLRRGKALMDVARSIVAAMVAEEQQLLTVRQAMASRAASRLTIGLLAAAIALSLLGAIVLLDARARLRRALDDADELARANQCLTVEATSREAAEAQVRQMQKVEAVGQLTGGIAHDFNNMLAIIIGSLDLAKRRLAGEHARAEQCIDNALEGAQRAAQLTGRLLAFSRQQPLAPSVLDMNKLVGGMSELLRRTIGDQVRVETILAGGLWRVCADAGQLENAVLNLCVNARDAMPDGGRLTVETSNAHLDDAYAADHAEVMAGQYVLVSITDTGVGMPAEVADRAFDPFYTTKGVGKGTGLGLSQVFGFIKQSGGHVMIYSEPGVGTTVKLYLPRYYGEDRAAEIQRRESGPLPLAKGDEIILVVEDDDRVRHLSVDTLRELGYTVVQASDAVQALAVLSLQPRVDLLFTDIVMPDMNGRQLADKAREARPDLRVLYTTGYSRNAIVHNGVLDPGVNFLAKPFTVEQLALKVREALDAEGM